MKNWFLLMFVFLSSHLFSQEVKYSDFSGEVKPKVGIYTSYVYKDGNTYKVGDKLILGPTSLQGRVVYAYIREVIPFLSNETVNISQRGSETVIKSLHLNGNKKAGYDVSIVCTRSLQIQLDNAIESGEVKLAGILSSDEALSELKKAKDKLDLGVITQSVYDSLKVAYMKFIK